MLLARNSSESSFQTRVVVVIKIFIQLGIKPLADMLAQVLPRRRAQQIRSRVLYFYLFKCIFIHNETYTEVRRCLIRKTRIQLPCWQRPKNQYCSRRTDPRSLWSAGMACTYGIRRVKIPRFQQRLGGHQLGAFAQSSAGGDCQASGTARACKPCFL